MTLEELALLSIPTLGILFKFSMIVLGMVLVLHSMSNNQPVKALSGKNGQ